jgi:hypothetical protein
MNQVIREAADILSDMIVIHNLKKKKQSMEKKSVLMWRDYPLNDKENVQKAMDKFAYTTSRMHPREKRAYAVAISKEAADYNIEPSGPITNYINDDINKDSVKLATSIRMRHIFDADLKADLTKLAENPHPEAFVEFDKIAGLTKYSSIPDGYASCYKLANCNEDNIKNISATVIERLFDSEFAKEWAKDPLTVYNSLPHPTQAMIQKQASVAEDVIPAATAMLAGITGYALGKKTGAQKVIDQQFNAKGWMPSKGVLYEKNFQTIVPCKDGFAVKDKDGRIILESDSLTKLVSML